MRVFDNIAMISRTRGLSLDIDIYIYIPIAPS
jgi:hypothetical protein